MITLIGSFTSVLTGILNVVLAFVILMIMITIHEFGHYTAGKLLKFKINEFSIGMGPKIFSKTKKDGQLFSIRALPIGGYCAFEGEDEDNQSEGAFNKQAPWKRLIVLFSGAFFNFLSAILFCAILFASYGETVATIGKTFDYAPTEVRSLDSRDIIYEVNGKRVYLIDSLTRYLSDDELTVTVLRYEDGYKSKKTITVKKGTFTNAYVNREYSSYVIGEVNGEQVHLTKGVMIYRINGVALSDEGDYEKIVNALNDEDNVSVTFYAYGQEFEVVMSKADLQYIATYEQTYSGLGISPVYARHKFDFGTATLRILPYCGETGLVILRTLGGLFTGATPINSLGGPVTTVSTVSQVVSYGFAPVLLMFVLISINLAVFNLLPVPALDGCRMVFVLIEWIAGKPVNRKVEAWINGIGLILLIGFMIVVDLLKL